MQELAGAYESLTHSQQVRRARSYAGRKRLDDSGLERMQRSGVGVGSEELGMWSPEMDTSLQFEGFSEMVRGWAMLR